MADGNGGGIKLSLADAIKYAVLLIGIGGGIATIQIQISQLSKDVVKYTTDVMEYRAEVRAMNAKFDRYIEILVEEQAARDAERRRREGSRER